MTSPRIYLDHAATSWPKDPEVLDAMDRYARTCGAAAGRGQYRSAGDAGAIVSSTRRELAMLIAAPAANCIAFFSNGTTALNAAIAGVIRPNDHVVTTAAEHNSVLRPLAHFQSVANIKLTIVDTDANGVVDAGRVLDAVTETTRLVAVMHASNVTGAMQPVAEIGRALKSRQHSAAFLCDAAQTFGYLPIDVCSLGVDLLTAPGHKGGGGPQGTGFLYVDPSWHTRIAPAIFGGTGSQSELMSMPEAMPTKLEPGNLNVAALAGWNAGIKRLRKRGESLHVDQCRRLSQLLNDGIRGIDGVTVLGQPSLLPMVSLLIEGFAPADLAAILDSEFGIETRAGLHCAARLHPLLGTAPDGTLRISAGVTTTEEEIQQVIAAVRAIAVTMHDEPS